MTPRERVSGMTANSAQLWGKWVMTHGNRQSLWWLCWSLMLATLHVFLPSPASGQGTINTVAGNGTAGFSGDGFLATDAALFGPSGVSVDRLGDIFIADFANNNIREVFCANSAVSCAPPPGFVANDITCLLYTSDAADE